MSEKLSIRRALAESGLQAVDAYVLLAHVLERNRAWLIAHRDDDLAADHAQAFLALARRRRAGEPIAYLTGRREFWGMDLRVSRDVLIPRPETETLVEVALAHLPSNRAARMLDLGTGSGAVALAIARERPRALIVATDVSPAALALAQENAQRLSVASITWCQADWYEGLPADAVGFDVIVSNPPYVQAGDAHLDQGDLRFEPAVALSPGDDSLTALRRIVAGARAHLSPGGLLAVEHGYDQGEAVRILFGEAGLREARTVPDLAGIARVTYGRFAG